MDQCCILAGGDILNYSSLKIDASSYIICADGGYYHAKKLNISPNVIIGDFDTLNEEVTDDCEIIKFPIEKDDTDTMLAIKLALERGYYSIKIYGATGGRLDHTIANIQSIAYINEHNASATIYGDTEIITMIKNCSKSFEKLSGYYFSLLSFSEKCMGVSTKGLKYNLENATLTNSFPLGISNEFLSNFCDVEVKSGTLLIIYSKQ